MENWIKPDVIYGEGRVSPAVFAAAGTRGPKGKAGPQGARGEAGQKGDTGPTEIGASVSYATFPSGVETFFGPDGDLHTGLAGRVTGQLVGSARELRYLKVVTNELIADGELTLTLYQSSDNGQSWNVVGTVLVQEYQRTASVDLNLSLEAGSLLCVSVNANHDYTGPVTWLLHN